MRTASSLASLEDHDERVKAGDEMGQSRCPRRRHDCLSRWTWAAAWIGISWGREEFEGGRVVRLVEIVCFVGISLFAMSMIVDLAAEVLLKNIP